MVLLMDLNLNRHFSLEENNERIGLIHNRKVIINYSLKNFDCFSSEDVVYPSNGDSMVQGQFSHNSPMEISSDQTNRLLVEAIDCHDRSL